MAVPFWRGLSLRPAQWREAGCCLVAIGVFALPCLADEIRLKDGKKLYGVIVAYEENMFKVKTEYGYVLVEKDKIASIIPTTPQGPVPDADGKQPAKNATGAEAKSGTNLEARAEPGTSAATDPKATVTSAGAKTELAAAKREGAAGKAPKIATKPDPSATAQVTPAATSSKAGTAVPGPTSGPSTAVLVNRNQPNGSAPGNQPTVSASTTSQVPSPAKPPEPPVLREEIQGNLYINRAEGFRMFKAPSWQLIEGAQNALPNAIAAMGTPEQSTLMVVGREKTKEPLDTAGSGVERRLHEVYENYRLISQKKAVVGGSPAVEFHFVGKADEHDWSGTLVVISRSADIFTVLGMTYADSDLIQIQENVIARAIASLSFDVK
jgi:hypothetical protein